MSQMPNYSNFSLPNNANFQRGGSFNQLNYLNQQQNMCQMSLFNNIANTKVNLINYMPTNNDFSSNLQMNSNNFQGVNGYFSNLQMNSNNFQSPMQDFSTNRLENGVSVKQEYMMNSNHKIFEEKPYKNN